MHIFVIPKCLSVTKCFAVLQAQVSWAAGFQHGVCVSGCGARLGRGGGGRRAGPPVHSVAVEVITICRTREHAKIQVLYFGTRM